MAARAVEAARRLSSEHASGTRHTSLSREFGITDLPAAYDVQEAFVPLLTERHGTPCGYKIGLTSKPMQEMCGIDTPIAGVVLEGRRLANGARISLADYGRVGIEFEVTVRMGADLGAGADLDAVSAAVDRVCASFELIDDRAADYAALDVLSLVADNSWNAAAVLSEFVEPPHDLAGVVGTLFRNGEEIGSGPGSAALGHPYEPVRWLADHLAGRGGALRKGDIVMTGSLMKTLFPEAGENYRFTVSGIGDVTVSFEE